MKSRKKSVVSQTVNPLSQKRERELDMAIAAKLGLFNRPERLMQCADCY